MKTAWPVNPRFAPASRSIQSAPAFFKETYDTSKKYSWAVAGFDCVRSSFYPDGYRAEQASMEKEDHAWIFSWKLKVYKRVGQESSP